MCDHCGCGPPANHSHGHDGKLISIDQDVLAHERAHAASLRARLETLDARLVNIIGSPGCGKTALLASLIPVLKAKGMRSFVVEGDLATDNDAKRIEATGAPAFQVMTGTACHLTAHDVERALNHLSVERQGLVIVENVGNLVCPSMFDLGESLRIVCLSVTEGTDKPQKYPVSFREAGLVLLTKDDLGPYVDFDAEIATQMIHDIKPNIEVIRTSASTGTGIEELAKQIATLWQ